MPTYPHIEAYYVRRQELMEFGGSDNELNIRPAFQNCLDTYCREHKEKLVLIPELKAPGNVVPDGTVKDTLRMARGSWEAKDTHDDLDAEIQRKFDRGYPKDNIVFEDSETAVLVQNGGVALRVDMSRPGELHRLIRRFLDYELPNIEEFRQAQVQFKTDLPAVLENLRRSVAVAEEGNEAYQSAATAFLDLCRQSISPDALPPVLVVLPQRNSGPGRQRWPRISQQLGRGLVEADHRPSGVIGFGVEVQQVLHVGHELRAHLGNAPFLLLPGLESVFLRRLRTPSWDMEDANFNSTTLPASRRRVQWSCPAGGGLQARAIRWASPRSSSFRRRLAWGRSFRTPANPSSVKRCLTRYTVPRATSRASATWGRWPTIVALEENPGPGGDSGWAFPNPNQTLEFFPLFRRQPHCVLVPDHHCHPPPTTLPTRRDSLIVRFLKQMLKPS